MVPASTTGCSVFTAYEYLESRFDGKTRTLAAALFLIQRGLAAGITIYAPALVLSVLLAGTCGSMCILLGGLRRRLHGVRAAAARSGTRTSSSSSSSWRTLACCAALAW